MTKDFLSSIKERRTSYGITKESPISNERIQELVNFAVMHTPTAFNSQSGRVVVLFGKNHDKLWDITIEALRKVVPDSQFPTTLEKLNSFKNGYGTILFFEDNSIIESLQKQFALYKDNFPIWSQQASGMLQLVVWTALDLEGLGASLQHYNPLIDDDVRKEWSIPQNWKLIAQMPFGKPTSNPDEKQFQPIENRVKVFK